MITSLFILQPTSLCNLNCGYCYVPDRKNGLVMTPEVLDASIRCLFNSSTVSERVTITWHAGEPLLAGREFFADTMAAVAKYNTSEIKVRFTVQTNATLIDQEWVDFFKSNDIEVGVSLDGPAFINDRVRVNWAGKSTHAMALRGVTKLKQNQMPLSAIAVLTNFSLDYADEIYDFFFELGFSNLSFNIDELECVHSESSFVSISIDQETLTNRYENFMSRIFDRWVGDKGKMRIREIDHSLRRLAVKRKFPTDHMLAQESIPFSIITVNRLGGVTTFAPELAGGTLYDPQAFVIGNVLASESFDDMANSDAFKLQLSSAKRGIENCARTCDYFGICGGGSLSNKFYEGGSFEATETMHCRLTKMKMADLVLARAGKINFDTAPHKSAV